MYQLFGHPKIMFSHFPELLHRHLFPSDPITLEYTVRVEDKDVNVGPVAYDVDVELENPLRDRIKMITQKNSAAQRDINALDEQVLLIPYTVNISAS